MPSKITWTLNDTSENNIPPKQLVHALWTANETKVSNEKKYEISRTSSYNKQCLEDLKSWEQNLKRIEDKQNKLKRIE